MAEELTVVDTDAIEFFYRQGWTDGLPIVPPTPSLTKAMFEPLELDPDTVIGEIPNRSRILTVEKAAINAVMAGCTPDYFPIVLAGLSAMLDPAFNADTALTSTGGAALCLIISGPLVEELDFFHLHNALGSGSRANATIGRALRLVSMNVFNARTGEFDASSIGHPGKYSMVLAETNPPASWPTLGTELGASVEQNTVTVIATEGPRQIANHLNPTPEGILLTIAAAMKCPSTYTVGKGAEVVVVIGYENRCALSEAGWSKSQIREFLAEHSRVSVDELDAAGILLEVDNQHNMVPDSKGLLPTVPGPESIFLVPAGGPGTGWSAYMPAWAPPIHSKAVTRIVSSQGLPVLPLR